MILKSILDFIHRHFRLTVGFICTLLIFGLVIGFGPAGDKVDASNINEKYFMCIDIEPDDTLWSIACEYMSEEYDSVEDYIAEIKSINNLTSDKIISGGTLVIPYYSYPQ